MAFLDSYRQQVALLIRVIPFVAKEDVFALKGGTAINLFVRDMPRLSVDIDLTYLPGESFDKAREEISRALKRIADVLGSGSPAYPVTRGSGAGEGPIDTLTVGGPGPQVKIEVNPVLRGTVAPPTTMSVRPAVSDEFGFAELHVLGFDDLFAGKLVAALDRQHPRDLFDVKLLLENEGISDSLFRTFIVYLVGHKGSIPDVLDPLGKTVDFEGLYKGQFEGMTAKAVPQTDLMEARERMAREIRSRLDDKMKRFLLSVQRAKPEWDLLGARGAQMLPAVRWRMHNLDKMKPEAMKRETSRLEKLFDR